MGELPLYWVGGRGGVGLVLLDEPLRSVGTKQRFCRENLAPKPRFMRGIAEY